MMLRSLLFLLVIAAVSCSKAEDQLSALAPIFGDGQSPQVIGAVPYPGQVGVVPSASVSILFNKAMNSQRCSGAFSISPSATGATVVAGNALLFTPGQNLATGTYNVTLSTSCEDLEGRDLEAAYSGSFVVGSPGNFAPRVVAVGLASQGGCTGLGSSGSGVGGDWTLPVCWWEESLAMLPPSSYTFRGGDTGTGALGLPNDCADVTTDNFRLIFNNYMNPGVTANATTLRRLSGPATTIRAASYSWSDCQAVSPFGCRALTVSFSELEASCNGAAAFGTIATGGDFNLGLTVGSPAGFPLYMIQVDTTALDSAGKPPSFQFNFTMEGK